MAETAQSEPRAARRITVAVDVDVTEIRALVKKIQRLADELNRTLAQYEAGLAGTAERLQEYGIDLVIGDDA